MKIFLLILSIIATYNCQNYDSSDWFQFKQKHTKFYKTTEEENSKFGIWQLNKNLIEEHNKKYELGLVSYTLRMNEFGDMVIKIKIEFIFFIKFLIFNFNFRHLNSLQVV